MGELPCILVVDDDRQVRGLFKSILERGGFSVLLAKSGNAALDVLRTSAVSVIVLDLNMPGVDGFEVLKFLRSHAPGVRILVISGFLKGALLDAASVLGADATLNKTEAPTRLLATVNELMKR
jgi:CheY-like chemotaxis protein